MTAIELLGENAAVLEAKATAEGLDLQAFPNGIAEKSAPSNDLPSLDKEEWLRLWQKAVDSMPSSDHFVDDSRESIYCDRV